MAGGGNDFLLFEADGRRLSEAERRRVSLLCRRGLSVGADGALLPRRVLFSNPDRAMPLVSPDGKRIVTNTSDRQIWIWNASDGSLLQSGLQGLV